MSMLKGSCIIKTASPLAIIIKEPICLTCFPKCRIALPFKCPQIFKGDRTWNDSEKVADIVSLALSCGYKVHPSNLKSTLSFTPCGRLASLLDPYKLLRKLLIE
jgi:hypothetical protein